MEDISRIGTVSKIDRENGMVSVIYEDRSGKVTQTLPFLSFNDEYKMPLIGDKVSVMHLSNGMEMAVVLGKYWNKANKPVDPQDTYRKQFDYEGKAFMRYKEGTGELLIKAPRIKVVSDEKEFYLEAPTIKANARENNTVIQSNVHADGDVIAGTVSLQKHTHTCGNGETSPAH